MNTRFTICSDVIGHLLPLDTSVLHFVVRMGARQGARDQQRVRLPHPHPWVARPISFVLAPIRTGKSKRTPMPPHVPLRCGVRLSPPALVLDYAEHDSGRVRRRIVPLRAFSAFSDVPQTVERLGQSERHGELIRQLSTTQLTRLLLRIRESLGGCGEDLNGVSDAALVLSKREMDRGFERRRLKPGDAGYEYDVSRDFMPLAPSEWDSD
ncbi:centrosomal protein of 19 kDa [Petromyzon marinus]|uniref:Centrosomal protein of 19 kDa n=1 Tax=Petromyzon marinus TaxID=7757 RepID=A0AAJ7WY14_PETMA|nr:centrosomal protein of 19 kDa isoform X1 [Petromyzon marinus]